MLIHNGEIGGASVVRFGLDTLSGSVLLSLAHVDFGGQLLGILFGGDLLHVDLYKIRIAHGYRAVSKHQLHCFSDDMGTVSGVEPHALQVKVLQDIEHLNDVAGAPGGGRSHRDNVMAPVCAPYRGTLFGGAFGQILLAQNALVLVDLGDNLISHRPLIEPVGTVFGNGFHSVGQLGIGDDLAVAAGLAIVQV